jgi:hypothetical protein
MSFSAFMQQYDELGFLNINLSLGTYLDYFDLIYEGCRPTFHVHDVCDTPCSATRYFF